SRDTQCWFRFGSGRNGARSTVAFGTARCLQSRHAHDGGAAKLSGGSYSRFRLAAVRGALFVWRSRGDRLVAALSFWYSVGFYPPGRSERRPHAFLAYADTCDSSDRDRGTGFAARPRGRTT